MYALMKPLAVAVATLSLASNVAPSTWTVDPMHTRVGFSVRHFFTPVTGQFDAFDVSMRWDPANPSASTVTAEIEVASVNTANAKRDTHLKSPDFFDSARNARITFQSTSVREDTPNHLIVTGNLTIKGVSRRVELPVTVLGVKDIPAEMQGMLGGAKRIASFEGDLRIDRRDFGVGTGSWGETTIVGSDVDIHLQLESALK